MLAELPVGPSVHDEARAEHV